MTLIDKIRSVKIEPANLILPQLLKKYISYARLYVHPKLTPEASKVLKEFYLSIRSKHTSFDSTPITTRQLESLIRLAEARAKMELREIITEQDAIDVVEIMKYYFKVLYQVFVVQNV